MPCEDGEAQAPPTPVAAHANAPGVSALPRQQRRRMLGAPLGKQPRPKQRNRAKGHHAAHHEGCASGSDTALFRVFEL